MLVWPNSFWSTFGCIPLSIARVSVSQSVHTETLDSVFITDFVKMGVIAAILTGLPRPKIDKDQISHYQRTVLTSTSINVGQRLIQQRRLLPKLLGGMNCHVNIICPVSQRDCAVVGNCFGGDLLSTQSACAGTLKSCLP